MSFENKLTSAAIHKQMQDLIQDVNLKLKDIRWRLRRLVLASYDDEKSDSTMLWRRLNDKTNVLLLDNPAHYYGMVLTDNSEANAKPSETSHVISFYLSYSTWDGRCLHVDQFPRGDKDLPVTPLFLLQTLGQLARKLDCRRLLWMQTGDPSWSFVNLPDGDDIIKPETLDEWLILKMDRPAMESYSGTSPSEEPETKKDTSNGPAALDRPTIEAKIHQICMDSQTASSAGLALRLVTESGIQQDSESIYKLVKGLAEYEKEPDAVQCRSSDYEMDGSGSHPLFYCLLLEDLTLDATCGMAFIYFGYAQDGGRFLYLEDLYLEPAFRRKGGGTLALKALSSIGICLDCSYLLWTALDWNQPALNLYSKMGAIVQDGLKISRYKDEELVQFVEAVVPIQKK